MSESTFADLGVPTPLLRALEAQGITTAFDIQRATLPDSLAGRDVLGRGRTGSGKTYAFSIPLVARLSAAKKHRQPGRPRAMVLAPTRELATQISETLTPLAKAVGLNTMTIFGGVKPGPQTSQLRQGVDIIIACPGRLEDLMRGGHVRLDAIEVTVLDEADHMADLGFLPGVKRLMDATPKSGQRLLFSATLDNAIDVLVQRYLTNPVTHSVDSKTSPVAKMTHHVLHVSHDARLNVIADLAAAPGRTLVFTRTKHGAKALTKQLNARGVPAVELHGNLSQGARTRNLAAFSEGDQVTMVATDIAARGIHVDDVGLVVHADPPVEHKAYLHRSGRTARAGSAGTVVTMMLDNQVRDVRDLTRKAGISPTITKAAPDHPVLRDIAPGERTFGDPIITASAPQQRARNSSARSSGARNPGGQRSATGQGGRGRNASTGGARGSDGSQPVGRRGPTAGAGSQGSGRNRSQSNGQSGSQGSSSSRARRGPAASGGSSRHSAANFSSRAR